MLTMPLVDTFGVGGFAAAGTWCFVGGRGRSGTGRRRLERLSPPRSGDGSAGGSGRSGGWGASTYWPSALGLLTVLGLVPVVGPLVCCAIGSAFGFALLRWNAWRRQRSSADRIRRHGARDGLSEVEVPAALDVLAACLSAGASLEHALDAVAEAFGGELGRTLAMVAGLSSWGAPIETAWAGCLDQPALAPVARAVIRASYSGATLTDVLTHQATDRRRSLRTSAAAAAQRAGVRAVMPLGLCFLPAFVLAGVVPVVAGFAKMLWH